MPRFSVDVYDPYSGWDEYSPNLSREEAWEVCKSLKGKALMVWKHEGDKLELVWRSKTSTYEVEHDAWLTRCPR